MSIRWFFTASVISVSFIVAGFIGAFVADAFQLWYEPVIGFFAAFAVVLSTYLSAPHHKLTSAIAAFFVGAVLAWILLKDSFYPSSYGEELAYTSTYLPLVVTYLGGTLGCLTAALINWWVGPNNSFKPTPLRGAA